MLYYTLTSKFTDKKDPYLTEECNKPNTLTIKVENLPSILKWNSENVGLLYQSIKQLPLPEGYYTYIALVDRRITRSTWWTEDKSLCMKFDLYEAAIHKAHSLKYGSCIVTTEDKFNHYVGKIYSKETHDIVNISIGD